MGSRELAVPSLLPDRFRVGAARNERRGQRVLPCCLVAGNGTAATAKVMGGTRDSYPMAWCTRHLRVCGSGALARTVADACAYGVSSEGF